MRFSCMQKGKIACLLIGASLLAVPALAWARYTVFHFRQDIPVSFTTPNPCNGEVVEVGGTEYLEFNVLMDGAGGAHFQAHFNFQDVMGQGSLGNTYQVPTSANEEANVTVGQEFTFEYYQLFVSASSAPNFDLGILVHVTVNPDGTVASSKAVFSSTCRG